MGAFLLALRVRWSRAPGRAEAPIASSRPREQTVRLDVRPRLRVDMRAVETAVYAASLPLELYRPGLSLETETCVWFNALCGRIYRDFINSDECFAWFGDKITTLLNHPLKLPKPAFIGMRRMSSDPHL